MGRFLHHVLRGLVVVFGLTSSFGVASQSRSCGFFPLTQLQSALGGATFNAVDQGEALARCEADRQSRAPYWWDQSQAGHTLSNPSGSCVLHASQSQYRLTFFETDAVRIAFHNCQPDPQGIRGSVARRELRTYTWLSSCATRPHIRPGMTVANRNYACERGCLYAQGADYTVNAQGQTVFAGWYLAPTGHTCTVGTETPLGRDPTGDDDGDGIPNGSDSRPDAPLQPNEPPPQPEPQPEPPGPQDDRDDGQQVANTLGPKLDAIEQAVLGLGPRIDGVRDAVNAARADANADADGIRSSLDGIRAAIVAQGPNGQPGDGEGPPDLSPLTPGNDGGPHPGIESVIERGDGSQLLGQLDRDGWALSRSCPAYTWPLSFELGWGTFDLTPAVDLACAALAILGFMIGLAGLIQASFILSRVGAS